MPYIPMEKIKVINGMVTLKSKKNSHEKERIRRSRERKKNNVIIIVEGENTGEIQKELHLVIQKMARKMELGYYIVPVK